jgi:glycosyltransferase involved in cell wall biosynthesis
LSAIYPQLANKLAVIPNPVDRDRMQKPSDFDRAAFRERLGFGPEHVVLAFTALGHFERKGLPLVLQAMASTGRKDVRLVVVGGHEDVIRAYEDIARRCGVSRQVVFAGLQSDVRPFLWSADALVFPSAYETFSLTCYEAAAAGLPVLATAVYGVEDFLRDGENGFLLERTAAGVEAGLRRFLGLSQEQRARMGERAVASVESYGTEVFVTNWRSFYRRVLQARLGQ